MKRRTEWFLLILVLSLCMGSCAKQAAAPGAGAGTLPPASFRVAVLRGPTALGAIKLLEDNPSLGEGVTGGRDLYHDPVSGRGQPPPEGRGQPF